MASGTRLQQIDSMVRPDYDHVWDCCCDHGLIGTRLLTRKTAPHVHFVDLVPELMATLEARLRLQFPRSAWTTHCIDAAALPLNALPGRHLVIVAGIGGDLMIRLITAIHSNTDARRFDMILCPLRHQYALRSHLIELGFSLKDEVLVEDRQRFYEILFVSPTSEAGVPITDVGENIWQADTPEEAAVAQQYLKKKIAHYERVQLAGEGIGQHIADLYKAIQTSARKQSESSPHQQQ